MNTNRNWKAPPLLAFTFAVGLMVALLVADLKRYQKAANNDDTVAQAQVGWFPGRGILRGVQAMRHNRAARVQSRMQAYEQPAYGVQRVAYSTGQPASYGSGGSQQFNRVSYYVPQQTVYQSGPSFGSSGGGGGGNEVVIDDSYDYPETETVIEETIVEEPAAEAPAAPAPTSQAPVTDQQLLTQIEQGLPTLSDATKTAIMLMILQDGAQVQRTGERPKLEGELIKSPIDDSAKASSPKPKTVVRKTIRKVVPQQRVITQAAPQIWYDVAPQPRYQQNCPGGVCPLNVQRF